jgi:hypothetical protein
VAHLLAVDVAEGHVVQVRVAQGALTYHRVLAHHQPALGADLRAEQVAVPNEHRWQVRVELAHLVGHEPLQLGDEHLVQLPQA